MNDAELLRAANTAMDAYVAGYQKRYNLAPICVNVAAETTILKDLIRASGLDHTLALIKTYLASNGDQDWFLRKGHSLDELKRNISGINALLGNLRQPINSNPLGVVAELSCDRCGAIYKWAGLPDELAKKTRLCASCKSGGGSKQSSSPYKQSRPLEPIKTLDWEKK